EVPFGAGAPMDDADCHVVWAAAKLAVSKTERVKIWGRGIVFARVVRL
ncbi:MAG: hypothetical protein ACI91B_003659, partial [Planctomycetota bacterium]